MGNTWHILHDADEDNWEPGCWQKEISHGLYGSYVSIWKYGEHEYGVEAKGSTLLKTCKSLASAKRWVAMNLS